MDSAHHGDKEEAMPHSCLVWLWCLFYIKGPITNRAEGPMRALCTGQALGWSTARPGSPASRKPVQRLSAFRSEGRL